MAAKKKQNILLVLNEDSLTGHDEIEYDDFSFEQTAGGTLLSKKKIQYLEQ